MTCSSEIHVNDIGTAFRITVRDENCDIVNLSGVALSVIFTKPDDTTLTKSGVLVTDGTDGQMQYISATGDLDVAGLWQIQAHINGSGYALYTNISKFKVYENLV